MLTGLNAMTNAATSISSLRLKDTTQAPFWKAKENEVCHPPPQFASVVTCSLFCLDKRLAPNLWLPLWFLEASEEQRVKRLLRIAALPQKRDGNFLLNWRTPCSVVFVWPATRRRGYE